MTGHASIFYIGGGYDTYVLCTDAELDALEDLEARDLDALSRGTQLTRYRAVRQLQPFQVIPGNHGRIYMRIVYTPHKSEFAGSGDGRVDRLVVLSEGWIHDRANSFHERFPVGLGLELISLYRPPEAAV